MQPDLESLGLATPEGLMAQFAQLVAAQALDELLALYEPAAVFIPQPGVVLTTPAAIREALGQMLGLRPVMETRVDEVHQAGDVALVIVDWTLRGTAPDGTAVEQGGRSTDVLRRQTDGSWRVLIDHP